VEWNLHTANVTPCPFHTRVSTEGTTNTSLIFTSLRLHRSYPGGQKFKKYLLPDVLVHTYNPSNWEAEAER
jgi:hypothetical protein